MSMSNLKDITVVGTYSYDVLHPGYDNIPTCFYYSYGNVVFIFDYNKECEKYFTKEHPEVMLLARKIVFCFSKEAGTEGGNVKLAISAVSGISELYCPVYVIEPTEVEELKAYSKIILLRSRDPERKWEIASRENSPFSFGIATNLLTIQIKPSFEFVPDGYLSYTIWRATKGMWEAILFYNGRSGYFDLSLLITLSRYPNAAIMYYINHKLLKDHDLMNKKARERILNTFDDLKNPVFLLGYKDITERIYMNEFLPRYIKNKYEGNDLS